MFNSIPFFFLLELAPLLKFGSLKDLLTDQVVQVALEFGILGLDRAGRRWLTSSLGLLIWNSDSYTGGRMNVCGSLLLGALGPRLRSPLRLSSTLLEIAIHLVDFPPLDQHRRWAPRRYKRLIKIEDLFISALTSTIFAPDLLILSPE